MTDAHTPRVPTVGANQCVRHSPFAPMCPPNSKGQGRHVGLPIGSRQGRHVGLPLQQIGRVLFVPLPIGRVAFYVGTDSFQFCIVPNDVLVIIPLP